jgi:hypothetical protein
VSALNENETPESSNMNNAVGAWEVIIRIIIMNTKLNSKISLNNRNNSFDPTI